MFRYHGRNKKKQYFEGWYFKAVHNNESIAFIPGMNIDRWGRKSAFIQAITSTGSYNFDFEYEEFFFNSQRSILIIGKNLFSERGMRLCLKSNEINIEGHIRFSNIVQLKYDIMGIFSYVPFMECRHGIISLWHKLSGKLTINNRHVSFDGGTGYIETDRGSSFPKSYIWTHSNYFNGYTSIRPCSVVMAAADTPFLGFHFKGCICVVLYKGRQYRLATYLGAKVIKNDDRLVSILQGKYLLKASLLCENSHKLFAPASGEMSDIIHESVSCRVRYRFYICREQVFDYVSDSAGFERR